MAIGRVHDLEIDQDLAFQRRSWTLQRFGWAAMALLLVLAAAGLLGSGPLSRQTVVLPGLLRVEYPRFTRYETPETLTVRLEAAVTDTTEVRLWLDREYLAHVKLEAVTPPPARVEAGHDRLMYVFPVSRPGEPVTITFALQSERLGPVGGRIGVAGHPGVAAFQQFVYP